MCIYFTEKEGLTYKNGEHIIPAGIGGKLKLPKSYVSDQFNNFISKHEQNFLRASIIQIPRQILGPGKRGSLQPKKQTKSQVVAFSDINDENEFSLGYLKKGKPFDIPFIALNMNNGNTKIGFPKENFEVHKNEFRKTIIEEDYKIKFIKFPKLDDSTFLIGIISGIEENYNCFVASRSGTENPFTQKILLEILTSIEGIGKNPQFSSSKVKTYQSTKIDLDFYRCCAKMAFNFLSHNKGASYVLNIRFKRIREFIVTGVNDELVQMQATFPKQFTQTFPENSHQIIISKIGNKLIANVCLYNHFNTAVLLSDNFEDEFEMQGFICDWQKEIEYNIYEYLSKA